MSSFRDFIDKIASYVGPDGFQHACVSAIIVFVLDALLPLWGAVVLALLIGVGKEVADYQTKAQGAEGSRRAA